MDRDRNGFISFEELYQALRDGAASEFNRDTVRLLLAKYDKNNDSQISFTEFNDLFVGINQQFNDFLDIDQDFSGSIDINELNMFFQSKGFEFRQNLYNYIISNIARRTGTHEINFDTYLKIRARFDQLNKEYQRGYKNEDKETFFGKNFFKNF